MQIVRKVLGPVQTNVYFVFDKTTKQGVIIDPADHADRIEKTVEALGFTPAAVFLTHGHFDHISAAEEVRDHYGVKLYALEEEKETLLDPRLNGDARFLRQNLQVHADAFWHDGDTFEMLDRTWQVIWTPGHTHGACCLYVPEEKVLFSGDTLFQGSFGRYDMPGGDFEALKDSLLNKLFLLPDDVSVFPGHMEDTTIGFEKRYNPIVDSRY